MEKLEFREKFKLGFRGRTIIADTIHFKLKSGDFYVTI